MVSACSNVPCIVAIVSLIKHFDIIEIQNYKYRFMALFQIFFSLPVTFLLQKNNVFFPLFQLTVAARWFWSVRTGYSGRRSTSLQVVTF